MIVATGIGKRIASRSKGMEAGKVAQAEISGQQPGERRAGAHAHRLEPGGVYIDLDDPARGPFVATGDEEYPVDANIVAQDDMDKESWDRLVAEGWGESKPGTGDRSYDAGAFGQEDDPRSDVLNAAPPGVGEGLTPEETEEERPRS